MLMVRHLWPSKYRFIFNCYCHWSSLVFRNRDGMSSFLHSKEGVTQGYPLAIILYGINILPLIKNLKREIPDVTKHWYVDDTKALYIIERIETYFELLTRQGPGRGYYPETSKSVWIVHLENLEAGKYFGACHGFKVCTGAHYIGGYIREEKFKIDWLRERTLT